LVRKHTIVPIVPDSSAGLKKVPLVEDKKENNKYVCYGTVVPQADLSNQVEHSIQAKNKKNKKDTSGLTIQQENIF